MRSKKEKNPFVEYYPIQIMRLIQLRTFGGLAPCSLYYLITIIIIMIIVRIDGIILMYLHDHFDVNILIQFSKPQGIRHRFQSAKANWCQHSSQCRLSLDNFEVVPFSVA